MWSHLTEIEGVWGLHPCRAAGLANGSPGRVCRAGQAPPGLLRQAGQGEQVYDYLNAGVAIWITPGIGWLHGRGVSRRG